MISAEAFLAAHGTCETPVVEPGVDSPRRGTWSHGNRPARRSARSMSRPGREPEDPCDVDACRESALRLLDAADRPSGALRDRLIDKGYDDETVAAVVDRLIEVGLVDDESYAQSAVRYCVGRLMGYRGAVMELARKGGRPSAGGAGLRRGPHERCLRGRRMGVGAAQRRQDTGHGPESAQAPVLVLGRAQGARRRNPACRSP